MAWLLVGRATGDALAEPDLTINIEICDILNNDPGQTKEAIKAIKKRIGHKNPSVQLLALTLLEMVIKNCGNVVHMLVADKGVLHEMVKIVKKKPDHRVKEKILILIDTWQEAFGGPSGKYVQYHAAYQELLLAGVVFPARPESSVPIFTPPQTQPLQYYPPALRIADHHPEEHYRTDKLEPTTRADLPPLGSQGNVPSTWRQSDVHTSGSHANAPTAMVPVLQTSQDQDGVATLSLTELQSARGIMDVLSEMLSALNPGSREELKQEVIVDLVQQCRGYKKRIVELVNTISDEKLLSEGLALNDDLQRVLAKHDAIAAGIAVQKERPKVVQASSSVAAADDGWMILDPRASSSSAQDKAKEPQKRSPSNMSANSQFPFDQLALQAPPPQVSASSTASSAPVDFDLLSGEYFTNPKPDNSLALVPSSEYRTKSEPNNNSLAVVPVDDLFAGSFYDESSPPGTSLPKIGDDKSGNLNSLPTIHATQTYSATPQLEPQPWQPVQASTYPSISTISSSTYGMSPASALSIQPTFMANPQQQIVDYGKANEQAGDEDLPPPPWEAETTEDFPVQNSIPSGINQFSQLRPSQPTQPTLTGQLEPGIPQPQHPALMPPYVTMYPLAQPGNGLGYYPQQVLTGPLGGINVYSGQPTATNYAYGQQADGAVYMANNVTYYRPLQSELTQGTYGRSMQSSSVVSSNVPLMPSSSQLRRQPKPEDALFGDLLSMAKSKS